MYFIIDSQCGGKSTCTQTGNSLNCKKHIIRCMFLMGQSKLFQHGFLNRHGLTYMTGSTITYLNNVLAFRFKGKMAGGEPDEQCRENLDSLPTG